jgi:hypothetical protein
MSVLEKLAGALGRNDERPNVALAEELVANPNAKAIDELVAAIAAGRQAIANDAIKVLYEIGERRPELLKGRAPAFLAQLKSRNNRMVWGALTALAAIAKTESKAVAAGLDEILAAADKGSVIAKDMTIKILANLASSGHAARTVPILIGRLRDAADNQLPMYAELTAPVIDAAHRTAFVSVIEARLKTLPQPAKRARVERVLRRLG